MLTCFKSILSDVHYTTATRDSLTALRRLSSPVSYVRLQRTLCGVCTPLHQRGRDVRLDKTVRGDGRSTSCAGRATVFVHSCTGRGTRGAMVARKTWGKATPFLRTVCFLLFFTGSALLHQISTIHDQEKKNAPRSLTVHQKALTLGYCCWGLPLLFCCYC
jgi:hypothetical protein